MSIEASTGTGPPLVTRRLRLPRLPLLRAILRHKGGAFGVGIVLFFVFFAIFGQWVAPYGPNANDMTAILQPPSPLHWFGTDALGRDTFSRVIDGSRIAIGVAFISVSIGMVVGIVVGILSGYFGGLVDAVLNRSQDVLFAFPTLLLAIIMVAVLGPGLVNSSLAIAIVYPLRADGPGDSAEC